MSNATIDSLLQVVVPSRAVDAPARPAEDRDSFAPALRKAFEIEPPARDTSTATTISDPVVAVTSPILSSDGLSVDRAPQGRPADSRVQASGSDAPAATPESKPSASESRADEHSHGDDSSRGEQVAESGAAAPQTLKVANGPHHVEKAKVASEGQLESAEAAGKGAKGASAAIPANEVPSPKLATGANETVAGAAASDDAKPKDSKAGDVSPGAKRAKATKAVDDARGDDKNAKPSTIASDAVRGPGVAAEVGAVSGAKGNGSKSGQAAGATARKPVSSDGALSDAKAPGAPGRIEPALPQSTAVPIAPADAPPIKGAANGGPTKPLPDSVRAINAAGRSTPSLDRLATGRSIHPGGVAAEGESTPQVDQARFIQRVEGALRAAQQRDGKVQVRLSPPELGSLKIELSVQHGVLTAKVQAETHAARNALLDNLPALRERLAQQDIRIEKFDVDVRQDGGGASGGGGFDKGPSDQPAWRQDGGRTKPAAATPGPALSATRSLPAALASDASLDVRI